MTELLNIGTMKGKVLFLALALVSFFAILAIAPSPAQAQSTYTTDYKDGCTLQSYTPYKADGKAHSVTRIKCNST